VLALGVAFGALGVTTDLVERWDETFPMAAPVSVGQDVTLFHIPNGPLFPAYQVFLLVCTGGAVAGSVWLAASSPAGAPLRGRFVGLLASGLLFLAGGAYIAVASGNLGFTALPGETLLIAGMLIMGWNVARYGALLAGEVVAADFVAFCVATFALVGLYAALLTFVPREAHWPLGERFLLLVLLTTHALADPSSRLLDRALFDPASRFLRSHLRQLSDRVVRSPDPFGALVDVQESVEGLMRDKQSLESSAGAAVPDEFRAQVEGALRHMNDLPALSRHALLGRTAATLGATGTAVERAILLRDELHDALGRLRPAGTPPAPLGSSGPGAWLHYLVLNEAYCEGRPNKHIMQRYFISESTFHRARRRAVDTIALDLHQRVGTIAAPPVAVRT
jgi:hypothetical protein